jgi:hypothetical protein
MLSSKFKDDLRCKGCGKRPIRTGGYVSEVEGIASGDASGNAFSGASGGALGVWCVN